jgi:hypothetical protein
MAHSPATDDRFGAQSENPTLPDHVWKPLTCLMAFPSSSLLVIFVPDHDRLFRHPVVMINLSVTPMHHQMSMGSSADCRPPLRCRA